MKLNLTYLLIGGAAAFVAYDMYKKGKFAALAPATDSQPDATEDATNDYYSGGSSSSGSTSSSIEPSDVVVNDQGQLVVVDQTTGEEIPVQEAIITQEEISTQDQSVVDKTIIDQPIEEDPYIDQPIEEDPYIDPNTTTTNKTYISPNDTYYSPGVINYESPMLYGIQRNSTRELLN